MSIKIPAAVVNRLMTAPVFAVAPAASISLAAAPVLAPASPPPALAIPVMAAPSMVVENSPGRASAERAANAVLNESL